jgi:hypothetical protein
LLWKTGFVELWQEQTNNNLAHGLYITAGMLMGRELFEFVDNQLQYSLQA